MPDFDHMQDPKKLLRRMARAALEQALINIGIPLDYFILPQADDFKQLDAVGNSHICWLDGNVTRAHIYFDEEFAGYIEGSDAFALSYNPNFYPDDYDLKPEKLTFMDTPGTFRMPFDITEIAAREMSAWLELPLIKLRRPIRTQIPTVVM